MKFILGIKQEMNQIFLADGQVVPVTRIQAGPCLITQKKDKGYRAVQVAFQDKKKVNKALRGFFQKILKQDKVAFRYVKEFRFESTDAQFDKLNVGQRIDVSVFKPGDKVEVQGTGKGRGFQGVVKRHGFHGGKKSHGHKDQLRMPGSIGAKGPARVMKGRRMGGHMGDIAVTVKNLEIVQVLPEKNELLIKGAIPGARKGLIYISGDGGFDIKSWVEETPVAPVVAAEPQEPQAVMPETVAEVSAPEAVNPPVATPEVK